MNVQLLLLMALVGPFCTFTHASPTVFPTSADDGVTEITADTTADATHNPKDNLNVVTGPPPTDPVAAPGEVATEVATVAVPPSPAVTTEEPIAETQAPIVVTAPPPPPPEPVNTDAPAVETAAPSEVTEADVPSKGTAVEPHEEVVVEGGNVEGLSSGQVVGIVIGALLAVVIVIAVVIAAVRRMGKYSP
ncbi:podoplanin [Chaetodon trifascialis]|uniref:podoplanin n=1 Tax=Chaetodon trifascialis TaxID=109706 RepID=UPI003992998B